MEEKYEQIIDKKNNSILKLIIIAIIALVIIGGGIFVCYKKGIIFNSNKTTPKTKNKNELTEKDLDSIYAYKALKYFIYLNPNRNGLESFDKDELVASFQYYYSGDEKNYKLIKDYDTSDDLEGSIYEMNIDEISNFIKKVFGASASVNGSSLVGSDTESKGIDILLLDYNNISGHEDAYFLCGFKIDGYNESTKRFTLTSYPGCGIGPDYEVLDKTVKFVKATKKDDELVVTLKALYDDCDDNYVSDEKVTCKIYSDYKLKNKVGKKSVDFGKKISFKEFESKASTIEVKFKLDENTKEYYFVSSSNK